jgi:Uma2 family endonuclease
MVSQLHATESNIIYPDSDGQPMADNTEQFRWIVTIQQNLDWLFADDPNVFVAGDLLWYPMEGNNTLRMAPDVLVAFGRPKGKRGSYRQWQEDNIAPQVVFEILSPGNTLTQMNKKQVFYDRYGVEEYYLYDPDDNDLSGWLRVDGDLDVIDPIDRWVSPRLGIRFERSDATLQLYRPDGTRFLSYIEISQQAEQERQRAEQEHQRAEQEHQRAEQERQRAEQEHQRAEQERQRAERLAEQLRAMGVDPDSLGA